MRRRAVRDLPLYAGDRGEEIGGVPAQGVVLAVHLVYSDIHLIFEDCKLYSFVMSVVNFMLEWRYT